MTDTPAAAIAPAGLLTSVTLDHPIQRGEQTIHRLSLRRPRSGELRGLNLVDLAQLSVNELRKLLPRISSPTLTEADVDNLDPADLLTLGAEVSAFLLPKAQRPASLDASTT